MRTCETASILVATWLIAVPVVATHAQDAPRTPAKEVLPPKPPPPDEPPPEDGGPAAFHYTTDEAIAFFRNRVEKNPEDYISLRYLGELYERKARESGDHAQFQLAETALRKSVALYPNYPRAQASLAAVLCSRHKFAEGLEIAQKLVAKNPKDADARASLGDALLELGRYPEAEAAYRELLRLAPYPEVTARLANLAELRGQSDEALRLMRSALESVTKTRLPKEAGWYHARLGEILFNAGRYDEAARQYEAVPAGIDAFHDATFGLGRVRFAQGRGNEALQLFKQAVAIGPDIHMLASLGDLYARTGDTAHAEETYARLESVAPSQAEHSRDLAYFYADHDRKLSAALELATKEFSARQDIFTRDALAWASFKNGRLEQAAKVMDEALALGANDARIYYHAGKIQQALGANEKAKKYLEKALSLNPYFSILQADDARSTLAALKGP